MELLLIILVFAVLLPTLNRAAKQKAAVQKHAAPQRPTVYHSAPSTKPRHTPMVPSIRTTEYEPMTARPSLTPSPVPYIQQFTSLTQGESAEDRCMVPHEDVTTAPKGATAIPGVKLAFDRNALVQGVVYAEILHRRGAKR